MAVPIVVDGSAQSLDITHQAQYWIDTSGRLSPEQVASQEPTLPFDHAAPGQVYRLEGGALWLRFDLQETGDTKDWSLELPVAGIDLAQLYYRQANGNWVRQQAGDSLPMSAWAESGRYPLFNLAEEAGRPVRYYLRIQHARVPFSTPLRVLSHTEVTFEHELDHLLLGGYFGLMTMLVVLAAVIGLAYQDAAFAIYALYALLLGLTQAAFTGIAEQYLWPQAPRWSDASTFLFPMLAAASALWFVRLVTRPQRISVWLDCFFLAMIFLLTAGGASYALAPSALGFQANNVFMSASMGLVALMVGLSLRESDRSARWLALGFLPVLVSAVFPLLRNFGMLQSSFLTSYALMLGSALEAPILFYGIYARLSERRETQVRAHALSQNDPLTGVSLERVLLRRIQRAVLRAERYQQQCAFLLVDVSNYPEIKAQYGREATARTLVVAASRLRSVVRDIDTVARVGEHHFSLLLEAPYSADQALSVATHAVAKGLQASENLPGASTLRFRVAVALLPWNGYSTEQVVHWARLAVAKHPASSPKAIMALNF